MLVLNLPFKALMFLTLMRPSLVLFLVLWLKLVKDFLKVRCRLALLPFLISCLIWLDLVASLPLIKERILVIILLLHFLSLMLGSVLVLMLPLLVWLTPDLRIKKSLLKCNWTIRKRLPFFCVSKNVSVSCAYTQGKREQFSGFNRTLDAINNVFRKFSAFHDETGRLNVDGMNIISNDGSNKLNRSRKARVSYKVQRTINASLNAATSTRAVSSNPNFVTRQKIEIIFG